MRNISIRIQPRPKRNKKYIIRLLTDRLSEKSAIMTVSNTNYLYQEINKQYYESLNNYG